MMTHRKLGRRRDQICDHWNGSASDGCDTIWPYWVFGIAAVAREINLCLDGSTDLQIGIERRGIESENIRTIGELAVVVSS